MPFHPMAENKHWRDNRMYFGLGRNWFYQKALTAEFDEDPEGFGKREFWLWLDKNCEGKDVKVVWCNVYNMYALHFINDEAKLEFLLKYGKAEPIDWSNIKIPIIRNIIPKTIAAELLAVQPMTAPDSLIFSTKFGFGIKKEDDEQP